MNEAQTTQSLGNPITFDTFNELLVAILNVVIIISVPFVVLFIIYAGYQYVTAQGNPEKIKTANSAIIYAIIGAVIILGSVAILEIIRSVVDPFQY